MSNTLVGNALKSARNNAALSVNYVVEQLLNIYNIQVSAKTLYGWEAGRSQPDIDTFLSLCQIYNVPALDFAKIGNDITSALQNQNRLEQDEYHIMAKYRRLNDSGKEYVDSQVDYALSQERYQLKEKRPPHIPDMKNIKEDAEAFVEQLKKQSVPTEK